MPPLATTARKLVNAIPSMTSRAPNIWSTMWAAARIRPAGGKPYPNVKRTEEAHDGHAVSSYGVDRHFHAAKADCSPGPLLNVLVPPQTLGP
jgi:hypothetical protein